MTKIFSIIMLVLTLVSCQKEDNYFVDAKLQSFFDTFENEAQKRNLGIDLKSLNILGKMMDIKEENVPGQCQYYNHKTWVVVDPTYWNEMEYEEQEALIFHELGHAALHREHLNTKGRYGVCISLMHGSSGACKLIYNQKTRSQYLDELFE